MMIAIFILLFHIELCKQFTTFAAKMTFHVSVIPNLKLISRKKRKIRILMYVPKYLLGLVCILLARNWCLDFNLGMYLIIDYCVFKYLLQLKLNHV